MTDIKDTEIVWQHSGNPECLHSHAHALLHAEHDDRPQAMKYPTVDYDWMKHREGKRIRHRHKTEVLPVACNSYTALTVAGEGAYLTHAQGHPWGKNPGDLLRAPEAASAAPTRQWYGGALPPLFLS